MLMLEPGKVAAADELVQHLDIAVGKIVRDSNGCREPSAESRARDREVRGIMSVDFGGGREKGPNRPPGDVLVVGLIDMAAKA